MVKKGHPLVLHLPVSHRHLLDALFLRINLSFFQFLQTEVTTATWCSKQEVQSSAEESRREKKYKNLKIGDFSRPGRDVLAKTLCMFGMREETLQ